MDESHILSQHNALMDRKKSQEESKKAEGLLPPMSCVRDIDESVKVDIIVKLSDMTVEDVITAKSKVPGRDNHFLIYATGLSLSSKIPEEGRIPSVLFAVMDIRNNLMGKRLEHYKRDGGLKQSGEPKFKKLCYSPTFDEAGVLSAMAHKGGAEINPVPAWAKNINTVGWKLLDNHDD